MEPVTIWANPRCSKSRAAEALLADHGLEPTVVRYLDTPPNRAELERVLALLGTDDPRVLLRTGEPKYRELGSPGRTGTRCSTPSPRTPG